MDVTRIFIYLTPSDDEERVVNMGEVREAYRIKDTVGWTYRDGKVSTCKFKNIEEAINAFSKMSDMLTDEPDTEYDYIPTVYPESTGDPYFRGQPLITAFADESTYAKAE